VQKIMEVLVTSKRVSDRAFWSITGTGAALITAVWWLAA
jgi:hypothetical protein